MSDRICPYITDFKPDVPGQCSLVKEDYPCYGYVSTVCGVRSAYDLGFERGREERLKGDTNVCRVFVSGQDVTENVMKRLKPFKRKPVTIQAVQMNYDFEMDTPRGHATGSSGDFVIRDAKDEMYPCPQSVFFGSHEIPDFIPLTKPKPPRTGR